MHEVSLVAELVEACERLADGAPVRRVRVRHASSLPPSTVRQAFELLTAGTALAGTELELASFDVEVRCACGYLGLRGHDDDLEPYVICPSCDGLISRPRTPELELVAVVT
jgi:Zn finger protein HypA/HybF involved in hydrogenase expression